MPAKASGRKGVGWHPSGKFQVAGLFLTSQKILRRASQNVTSKKICSQFFNTQKGFGFITPADGSRDVFVHISHISAVERSGMSTVCTENLNPGVMVMKSTEDRV